MVCSNYTECVKTALGTSQALHEGMRMITSVAAGQAMYPPMPISPSEPPGGVGPGVCTLGLKCYRTDVPFYVRRYMGHTGDSRSSLVSPSGPFAHMLLLVAISGSLASVFLSRTVDFCMAD